MTVVLVDDDDAVRGLIERILRESGYRVESYASGEDALTGHGGAVDVLISDMALPGMSGLVLAHWIASRHPGLPTVLISGYPHNRDFEEASLYGWQLLEKPFGTDALLQAIERARTETARRHGS